MGLARQLADWGGIRESKAAVGARATRTVVAGFGAVVAIAGLEHGIGELLQGPVAPDALLIESWPDAAAFEVLSGEPAMTVIPNLLVAGLVTVLVASAFGTWAVAFAGRRHGGLVLIGLSVLLLLVGGGLAPPLIGVILGLAATRIGASSRTPAGTFGRALARLWSWALAIGVLAYLGLFPGLVLASALFGLEEPALVIALAATAFGALMVALVAARAADRLGEARAAHRAAQGPWHAPESSIGRQRWTKRAS
jgi:hypothetical protein